MRIKNITSTLILGLVVLLLITPTVNAAVQITEYPMPSPNSGSIKGLELGSDGNMWFLDFNNFKVVKVLQDGTTQTYSPNIQNNNTGSSRLGMGLCAGPDGNLWYSHVERVDPDENELYYIDKITTSGESTSYLFSVPQTPNNINSTEFPFNCTAGPDGNIWYSGGDDSSYRVFFKVSTSGQLLDFYEPPNPEGWAIDIKVGADGNLWSQGRNSDNGQSGIARITPDGVITEFLVPDNRNVFSLEPGSDGNMWYYSGDEVGTDNQIGKITPNGEITQYSVGSDFVCDMALGPDNNIWFSSKNGIGKITPNGEITIIPTPSGQSTCLVGVGADSRTMWATSYSDNGPNKILKIELTELGQESTMPTPTVPKTAGLVMSTVVTFLSFSTLILAARAYQNRYHNSNSTK